jgi:AbrB family looped-hinge helix DNA binding protein
MGISKITRNFQITLPKDVRIIKKLEEGDAVVFAIEGNDVILEKVEEDPIMASAGIWKNFKETGAQYQKRLRGQWKKRQKQLEW